MPAIFKHEVRYLLWPGVTICFLIWFVPFMYQIFISLHNYNLNDPSALNTFAGISNYVDNFKLESPFLQSGLRTIVFTAVCLGLEILLGLLGALILFDLAESTAQRVLSIIIIPSMIAPFAVGLIWYFQFNPDFGPLSVWLRSIGIFNGTFLSAGNAFASVSLVDTWEFTPFMIFLFYSGLRAIPRSTVEALTLDNISYSLKLRKVYLKEIMPIFTIAVFLRGAGLLKSFDSIYILTGGGPGQLTEMLSVFAQRINYKEYNFGLGAAQGVIINYAFLYLFNLVYKRLKVY